MPLIPAETSLFPMCSVGFSVTTLVLVDTHLAMWIWRGVLLQDLDAVTLVRPIEMVPQSPCGAG